MGKNPSLTINTPKSTKLKVKNKGAVVEFTVAWAPSFGPGWTSRLQRSQTMFDTEVLRITDKYVAMDTGMTKNSAITASDIGGGELLYNTPYAGWAYRRGKVGAHNGTLRGPRWGNRMKADNLSYLANFARKAVGGK